MDYTPEVEKATATISDAINTLRAGEAIPLLIAALGLAIKNATHNDTYFIMNKCLPRVIRDLCRCWGVDVPRIEMANENYETDEPSELRH